jgi:5-hydroxyisourate hydrolase
MSPITTHVLDVSMGRPAAGVAVVLEHEHPNGWHVLTRARTDDDGRVRNLMADDAKLVAGTYRLSFEVGAYFAKRGTASFYPSITIAFSVAEASEHHHVPLLLSPYGYTTYRGS